MEAAMLLLTRPYPQAAEALNGFLTDPNNRPAQIAVAEAIARQGDSQKAFVDALIVLLTGPEAAARGPAGRALAAYKDATVTARLQKIATDRKREVAVRLATIAALERAFSKETVDVLVQLLDDPDNSMRGAAADALAKLTSIRAFGADPNQWKRWWAKNKSKDRTEWLADLADSLAQTNAALAGENERLRTRLAETILNLYSATPPAQKDAMLMGILKDALPDVRLVGAKIVALNLTNSVEVSKAVRGQVRAMLTDADPRVRQEVVLLTASLGDGESVTALLDQLKSEQSPAVRLAILKALGQLQDVKALPTVLAEIQSKTEESAAAAAGALAKIAAAKPLAGTQRTDAVKALVDRYRQLQNPGDGEALREALLRAMGVVGDKAFAPVMVEAMKDSAAAVRLAAVDGLKQVGETSACAELEKLVNDPDRGVRQATIAALSKLGGAAHLKTILQRTDPTAEQDPAVRQQAWDEVMGLLAKADVKTLRSVLTSLVDRKEALPQQVRILQMLVVALKAQKSAELPAAQRELGLTLMKVERPTEAAPLLAESYASYAAAKDDLAKMVWLEWVESLLAADEPSVAKVAGDQTDEEAFAKALSLIDARLEALRKKGAWSALVALADEAVKQLPKRITEDQRTAWQQELDKARQQLRAADQQRVAALVRQLASAEEAPRKAAETELQTMADRAVAPLLVELKKAVEGANPGAPGAEKAILGILKQIAPKLTGYDPAAPKADRLKRIEAWAKEL
jgi:HEAT repeat protein